MDFKIIDYNYIFQRHEDPARDRITLMKVLREVLFRFEMYYKVTYITKTI
jgi:hypothetical protein